MASKTSSQEMIADSAIIDPTAKIGENTRVWAFVQIGEEAQIGSDCVLGNGAYIDRQVVIGDNVRIHNKALLYHGVRVEDDVFIGPGACFTNDPWPRSGLTRDLQGVSWNIGKGACIGANVTVLPDVNIGQYAVIGAGALVSQNIPDYALVYGNPGKIKGVVCKCNAVYKDESLQEAHNQKTFNCKKCGHELPVLK